MLYPYPSPVCPKCGYGTLFTKDGRSICTRKECGYDSRKESTESSDSHSQSVKSIAV